MNTTHTVPGYMQRAAVSASQTATVHVTKPCALFSEGMPPLLQVVDLEVEMINPADWDVVCDVRTPDEFEEDRLIGAISTPVLSNEQRAQVGTLYKQMYAHGLKHFAYRLYTVGVISFARHSAA